MRVHEGVIINALSAHNSDTGKPVGDLRLQNISQTKWRIVVKNMAVK
ncbi:MAG: hypothetical protein GX799_08595 [Crenarchaeota archaeon]|nr:hypothetical protein [Thermoproteota archaeon]